MEFKGNKETWELVQYHSGELIGVKVVSGEEIIFDSGLRGYIDDETEANAKLIAFAHEMLEFLQIIRCSETTSVIYRKKAAELIKKATE